MSKRVRVLAGLCAGVVSAGLLLVPGCTTTTIPLTDIEVPMFKIPMPKIPLLSRGEADFRHRQWTEAFRDMHERVAREYPYKEWKGIDWENLYEEGSANVRDAAIEGDEGAYYLALREYVYSVPDGHFRVSVEENLQKLSIGAGYGFAAIELEDGRVVAHVVLPEGAAHDAGMQWGAEILEWDGQPVGKAITKVSTLWAETPPATNAVRRIQQVRLLTRATAGTTATVRFRNPSFEEVQGSQLTAADDEYKALEQAWPYYEDLSQFEIPIKSDILPSGYGYLRVYFEAPTLTTPFPEGVFRKAINSFVERNVPGMVLDLRGNTGGDCSLVPEFAGHFYTESGFYQDVALYNDEAGAFGLDPAQRLLVESKEPHFEGPVVVLIDYTTFAAGEGIPMVLARLPQVQLVGFYDTNGAGGITGGDITMPQGHTLSYPVGRSLSELGAIQIEANGTGVGGIAPDVRVPLSYDNVYAMFVEDKDVLLEKALELLGTATGAETK